MTKPNYVLFCFVLSSNIRKFVVQKITMNEDVNIYLLLGAVPWAILLWPIHNHYNWLFLKDIDKRKYGRKMANVMLVLMGALIVLQVVFATIWAIGALS